MKKHRKLVALLVALTFLFSVVAPVMAAEPSAAEKAADKLNVLGIIEGYPDGTFGLDRNITRAEFAKVAVIAAGLKDAAEQLVNFPSQFSDVATGEWYTGWINMAASQGFVKGDPAGTYRPNDEITYAEVVTVLVRLLGYNDNLTGPWPTNYLAKAVELDITKDVALNANAPAVRGDVFIMTNNTLDCYTVKWSTEHQDFENLKAKLIVKSFKGSMFEGLVTDISWDSKGDIYLDVLYKDGDTLKGESLKVVENVIVSGADDPYGLVGWQVEFIKNQKSTGADRNAIVYLGAKDTNSVTKNEAKYDSRAKEIEIDKKKYDVASGFGVTYFPVDGSFDATKDATLSGDLVEVIINEDGDAQWAFVYQFKAPDIIEEIEDGKVYGHLKTRFEQKAKDVQVFIKDGVIADFDALAEGDLIYVFDGKDAKNADLLVIAVSEVFEGNLEVAHASWQTMTIDGTKYDVDYVNGDYIVSTDGGDTFNGSLNDDMFNDSIKYMFSPAGRIAVVISGATTQNLVGVVEWTGDAGARGVEVRILNPDGTKAVYYVDSDYAKDASGAYLNDVHKKHPVLVEYSLNKDGKIDKFVAAQPATFQDYDGSRARLTVGTATDWYRVNANAGFFGYDSKNNLVATDWDNFKRVSKPATPPQPTISVLMPKGAVKAMYINDQIVDVNKIGVIADSGRDGGKGFFYDIFIKGEKVRYNLASALQGNAKAEGYKKGDVVKFSLSGGKISAINDILVGDAAWVATGKVDERGADYVKVGGKYYYMDKDTMIVDVTESTKKIVRNVGVREDVKVYSLDSKGIVDLIVIYDGTVPVDPGVKVAGTIKYIDVNATTGKGYVDLADGSTVQVNSITLAGTLNTYKPILEGLGVTFKLNNAKEAIGLEVVQLGAANYAPAFANHLVQTYAGITVAGQGNTKTQVTAGNILVNQAGVTIRDIKINGDLAINLSNASDKFTSKSNHITGDVTVAMGDASFNTKIDGDVTVNAGAKAAFTNVEFAATSNLLVNGSATIVGSTGKLNAYRISGSGTIDATQATDAAVRAEGEKVANAAAVAAAKAKLAGATTAQKSVLTGTNVLDVAKAIVNDASVTVTIDSKETGNGKAAVSDAGVITGAPGSSNNVTFRVTKGVSSDTQIVEFTIKEGAVVGYKVTVTGAVYAGEASVAPPASGWTLKLEAVDKDNNVVKSFNENKLVNIVGFGVSPSGQAAEGVSNAVAQFSSGEAYVTGIKVYKAEDNITISVSDGTLSGTEKLSVLPGKAVGSVTVVGATAITIPTGETPASASYTAIVKDDWGNVTSGTVTWSLKEASVAGVNVDANTGVVSVDKTAAAGSFTVTATAGGKSGELKVTLSK